MQSMTRLQALLKPLAKSDVLGVTSLIDSTPLTLQGRGFDVWTLGTKTRRTQGVKVHVQCDAAMHAISRCEISAPNVNDVVQARQWEIQPGTTCVFDRAYCDYAWWARMTRQGVKFVTRLKRNAGASLTTSASPAAGAIHAAARHGAGLSCW